MLHRFTLDEGSVTTLALASVLATMAVAAFLLMYLPLR